MLTKTYRISLILIFNMFFAMVANASLQDIEDATLSVKVKITNLVKDDGSIETTTDKIYTALTEEGAEKINNFHFSYSVFDKFSLDKADYYLPESNTAIHLSKDMIDTKMQANQYNGFSSNMQTSINFPSIQKGSKIHLTTKINHRALDFFPNFFEEWSFVPQDSIFEEYSVEYITSKPLIIEASNTDDFELITSNNNKNLTIKLKTYPYYLNYVNENDNSILLEYPRIAISHSDNLQENYGAIAKRYNEILRQNLPDKLQEQVIKNKDKNQQEKIEAFMQYIYKNYRYFGDLRFNDSAFITNNLKQIVDSGFGDCKNLSIILVALLKASGIKAEVGFIYRGVLSDKSLSKGFISANHAIVRAEIKDQANKVVWLDPTNPLFSIDRPINDITDRDIIIIDDKEKARLEHVPSNNLKNTQIKKELEIVDDTEKAHLNLNLIFDIEPYDINMTERTQGIEAVNKMLCSSSALEYEKNSCKIERKNSNFFLKNNYSIDISVTDNQALKKLNDNIYLYNNNNDVLFSDRWNQLLRYKNNLNLLDLYLGEKNQLSIITRLINYNKIEENSCNVDTKWFKTNVKTEIDKNDTLIKQNVIWFVETLSHEDIISDKFQDAIQKAKKCMLYGNVVIDYNDKDRPK